MERSAAFAMIGVVFGLFLTSAHSAESLPARLDTYTDAAGKSYFALLVRDNSTATNTRPIDAAILVDLAAGQGGRKFQETVDQVEKLVNGLPAGSRVQIWPSNRPDRPFFAKPTDAKSPFARQIMEELKRTAPMGTSDLPSLFQEGGDWLKAPGETSPKTVVYIGSG